MGIREKVLERKMMEWCKKQGCLVLKIEAARGWPDRLILKPNGTVLFVEFKRPGAKPNDLQSHILQEIRRHHCRSYWVTSEAEFKHLYNVEY